MSDEIGVNSVTPFLFVGSVEACLPLWRTVGFLPVTKAAPFGFVILQCGMSEVMR